jgi:hypothetical protein
MVVCVLCACSADAGNGDRTERLVVGDTTIVRTLEGSVWGDSVALVEELSIGTLNGPPEYEFGQVQDVAVDANGGIYVFDGQVPALLRCQRRPRADAGRQGGWAWRIPGCVVRCCHSPS